MQGAPETIKGMLKNVPEGYDETYKWYTRRGSRVLALGVKLKEALTVEKVRKIVYMVVLRTHCLPDQQAPSRDG